MTLTHHPSRGMDSPERYTGATLSELIKVACQALIREADSQASELRRVYDAAAADHRHRRDLQVAQEGGRHNFHARINKLP